MFKDYSLPIFHIYNKKWHKKINQAYNLVLTQR